MRIDLSVRAEDIIRLVPDILLDNLASETGVDYSVKKLHGKHVFKLFLFAFLNGKKISLRIMETIFQSERFQTLFSVARGSIKHSGIGMRLQTIDYRYFEKIFAALIASPTLEAVIFGKKKIVARKIDSTIVTLSSKLLKVGLDDNPGKKSLKFGIELVGSVPVNIICFKGQSNLSEDNALPELILRKSERKALNIAIFDRGIQRKQNFVDFHTQGISFISRLSTQKISVLKELPISCNTTPSLTIASDQLIVFASAEGMKKETACTPFRLITGKSRDTGQEMKFLTNVMTLSAGEIATLYKSRWEIETFFRFIKQEMNFSHILSRSENGIKVVMYLTMIAAILLTLYKKMNSIVGWAVAKIKFLDELESDIHRQWHHEMTPLFREEPTLFPLNTS